MRFTPIAARQAGERGPLPQRQRVRSRRPGRCNPDILRRIEPVGALDRVRTGQHARAELAAEQHAHRPAGRTGDDRRRGGLSRRSTSSPTCGRASGARSTRGAPVKIDAYRRNLQRAYVDTLADRINGRQAAADDARAFFRGELKTLDADLRAARRAHRDRDHAPAPRRRADADRPRARPGGPGHRRPASAAPSPRAPEFDVAVDPVACWVDYAIRRSRRLTSPATSCAQLPAAAATRDRQVNARREAGTGKRTTEVGSVMHRPTFFSSAQRERHFDFDQHRHGLAEARAWGEAPLLDRLDRFLVETELSDRASG